MSKNFIVLEVSHGLVKRLKAIQRRIYLFEWILACKIPAKYSMSVMYLAGQGFVRTGHVSQFGRFYKNEGFGRVSDWWLHLWKHLGTNATNYFMY